MNKLTLPIIGLTGLIGYFLNKDGKNPRRQEEKRENIEKFDKPNGDNIYSSNKVNEVNQELLEKSLKMLLELMTNFMCLLNISNSQAAGRYSGDLVISLKINYIIYNNYFS